MSSDEQTFQATLDELKQIYNTDQMTVIAPDQPITQRKEDQFSRGLFAARVGRTIALRRDPSSVTIGIYAPWGEGKTSVLHLIEESLTEYDHVVPVWFNPWIFGTTQEVTQGFFETVANVLDSDLKTRKEKLGKVFKDYGKWVDALGNLAGKSLNGIDSLGESLATVSIEEVRSRMSKILTNSGKRVVVFMDDIDRLEKSEIQTVFKLIKLTADLEQIVYVLAFDDELVANALQERYGVGDPLAGRRFLEKIVQVPLRLPAAPRKTLRLYALKAVEQALQDAQVDLTRQQVEDYLHGFDTGLSVRITTPRLAKLHANAITFALPILEGEVDPVEAMLVEGVRVLYPALYDLIRKDPKMFLDPVNELGSSYRSGASEEEKQQIKDRLDQVLGAYTRDEQKAARDLLFRLFPRFKSVYRNEGHDASMDGFWAEGKRVAATQYFDRYFTYAIPLGDVADQDITSLIRLAESGSLEQVIEQIQQTVDVMNAATFIGKLRRLEDSCPLQAGLLLSHALVKTAKQFPTSDSWAMLGSRAQVSIFISEILLRVEDETERTSLATQLVNQAITPEVARDLIYWLNRPPKNQRHAEVQTPILSPAVIEHLTALMVQRIEQEAQYTDVLEAYEGQEARNVLYTWSQYSGRGVTQNHLQRSMDGRPDKVVKLLSCFTGTAFNLTDGRPTWGSFRRESYDSVSSLIDPDIIATELRAAGFSSSPMPERPETFELYLASEFLKIHDAVKASNGEGESE